MDLFRQLHPLPAEKGIYRIGVECVSLPNCTYMQSPSYADGGRKLQVNGSILTEAALNGEDRLEDVRIVNSLPGKLNEQTIIRLLLNL